MESRPARSEAAGTRDHGSRTGPGSPRRPGRIPDPLEPGAHRLLGRLLGERAAARSVLREMRGRGVDPRRPYLEQVLEVAAQRHPGLSGQQTMARIRGSLAKLPGELPELVPGFDPVRARRALEDVLAPEQVAVLELLFVDGSTPAEIAALFDVDPELVTAFPARVIEGIGRLDRLVHRRVLTCSTPADEVRTHLGPSTRRAAGGVPGRTPPPDGTSSTGRVSLHRSGEPPGAPADPACPACQRVRTLTREFVSLFEGESRRLSFSDPRMIAAALAAPIVRRSGPPAPCRRQEREIGAPTSNGDDRERFRIPAPHRATWAGVALAAAASLFSLTISTAGSFMDPARSTGSSGFHRGLSALRRTELGSWSDEDGHGGVLAVGSVIRAPESGPAQLTFQSGLQAVLDPGSCLNIHEELRFELRTGRIRVRLPPDRSTALILELGPLRGRSSGGSLEAVSVPEDPVRFRVLEGTLEVQDGEGRQRVLTGGELLAVSPGGGSYLVEDGW